MEENSWAFDPFALLRERGERYVNQFAREIALSLIPLPADVREPFWIESAQNLLTGAILSTDPFIARAFHVDEDTKFTFVWKNADHYNIFLCIPEDKLDQLSGPVRLLLNQLLRTLERRPDKHSPQAQKVIPALLLLDELPRFGKIGITNAVSTLRSKNVTIALFVQSLAQLNLIYGEASRKVIADNCSFKLFFGAHDPQSQRYMRSDRYARSREALVHHDLCTER